MDSASTSGKVFPTEAQRANVNEEYLSVTDLFGKVALLLFAYLYIFIYHQREDQEKG